MEESMGFEEMIEKFEGEWLLIEYEELDKEFAVKQGKVLFHSPNKNEVYEQLMEIQGRNIAIEYAGEIPKKLAVLFRFD